MSHSDRELAAFRDRVRALGIPLIGESRAFLQLLRSVDRVAHRSSLATVLIRGETGTGKELVARAIHYLGGRREFPFVPVNCGALTETLAENELFGHRPGAYTGANQECRGLLRLAHRGTLFLDEVDALPAKSQVALLRFLQDGRFRPLGSASEESADVRIVAASNRCLDTEVRAGRFRLDLFYRINVIGLEVPPLRERTGDVHLLSHHFLQQCAERYSAPRRCLHVRTRTWFEAYGWPGNVRELENLIHRESVLCDDSELCIQEPADLAVRPEDLAPKDCEPAQLSYRAAKARALQDFDCAYLTQLMRRAEGNVTRAAQLAGKERRALGKLLKRYRIVSSNDSTADVGVDPPV